MKLPAIITGRLRRKAAPPRRAVQTTLKATAAARRGDLDDYDSPEHTTSLSAAFMIVLLLHVVAVIGIYIFNHIKATRTAPAVAKSEQVSKQTEAASNKPAPQKAADLDKKPAPVVQTNREPAAPKPLPSGVRIHRIQPGESLAKIATTYSVTVADLEAANGMKYEDKIIAGQTLNIPANKNVVRLPPPPTTRAEPTTKTALQPIALKAAAPAPKPAAPKTVPSKPAAAKAELRSYTVDKGDTVTYIAKRHNVSADELMKLNGITQPTKLQPGRKLRIPAAK